VALKQKYDVVVVGSGPGGMAAAVAAKKQGAEDVLVIERDVELGGILLQCIHTGFGVEILQQDLPGPAYAHRFVQEALSLGVDALMDTMVLDISPTRHLTATSAKSGLAQLDARAIVLAMGCRERTRAQIRIPGTRPAGVYTAGTVQRLVNVEGYMPGKRFVILGSGDIGMIMARRLTFEGSQVERVLEIMPFLTGLTRNYVQCLVDFDIPLQLQHTIKRILGRQRVEAVEAVQVDERWNPVAGTEEIIPCDTLLLSVGLIPENELSRRAGVALDPVTGGPYVDEAFQTSVPGIFAAGNVVHVYDLVDWVTQAGFIAGQSAARFAISERRREARQVRLRAGENTRYVVPHRLDKESLAQGNQQLQLRVIQPIEARASVQVLDGDEVVAHQDLRYARPGEMVVVEIPQSAYDKVQKVDSLTVRVIKR
jgi:NADPH-dependent 2,4-dienoyl-CoA reductase/sulfur reductase-like enzyme